MVKDRRSTYHDLLSRTWITKYQGPAYLRGEQCLDYVISNGQGMMGEYGGIPEERNIKNAKFQIRQRSDRGYQIEDAKG